MTISNGWPGGRMSAMLSYSYHTSSELERSEDQEENIPRRTWATPPAAPAKRSLAVCRLPPSCASSDMAVMCVERRKRVRGEERRGLDWPESVPIRTSERRDYEEEVPKGFDLSQLQFRSRKRQLGGEKVAAWRSDVVDSRKMFGNKKRKKKSKRLWSERKTVVRKWKVESASWACDMASVSIAIA